MTGLRFFSRALELQLALADCDVNRFFLTIGFVHT